MQYFSMRGRWGTHYDALDPGFPPIGLWPTFFRVSFVPKLFFMEAYTVIVGALVGIAVVALLGRVRPARNIADKPVRNQPRAAGQTGAG